MQFQSHGLQMTPAVDVQFTVHGFSKTTLYVFIKIL